MCEPVSVVDSPPIPLCVVGRSCAEQVRPMGSMWVIAVWRRSSDCRVQFVERSGQAEYLCNRFAEWPRRTFWMKSCPAVITFMVQSVFRPRFGLIRAFSRPWSASQPLLAFSSFC